MLIPECPSDFFSLPPATAKEAGIEGSTLLQNGCKVVRCPWDVRGLESVTETIASRAPALNGLSPLHDKAKIWFWVDTWVLKRSTCMWTIWV